MNKQDVIAELEKLMAVAVERRDADPSEPNYSYQDGVADGYSGAIFLVSKLKEAKGARR